MAFLGRVVASVRGVEMRSSRERIFVCIFLFFLKKNIYIYICILFLCAASPFLSFFPLSSINPFSTLLDRDGLSFFFVVFFFWFFGFF